jgi:hypothetical protein
VTKHALTRLFKAASPSRKTAFTECIPISNCHKEKSHSTVSVDFNLHTHHGATLARADRTTYKVEVAVLDGEEREDDEPEHAVREHHSACIRLSTTA